MLKLKCYASPCEHMQQYAPHGIIPDHDAYEHYATTICLRSNFFKITTMQNIYIPHLSFSPKRIILYICAHPHHLSATISRRPLILPTQTRIAEYQDYGRNATQSEEADSDHIPLLQTGRHLNNENRRPPHSGDAWLIKCYICLFLGDLTITVLSGAAKLFLNAEELVVLCHAIGT